MTEIINNFGINNILIGIIVINLILLIGLIIVTIKYFNLNNRYNVFMKKLSKNGNIEEDLENYLYRVERVEMQNANIINNINSLNDDLKTCIQKVGIVRYSAFNDIGSDLSFTLALLDSKNNGVVLNGIYSREMSNIYAKPVKDGNSLYNLSEEEKEAISKAITSENIRKI